MISAVDVGTRAGATAVPPGGAAEVESQADRPALFGPRVKASGFTSSGLLVELADYGDALPVADSSEYDEWPDEPKDAPPLLLGRLLVELTDADGVLGVAGVVSWHRVAYGPNAGSHAWNIGIGLVPAARGHGVGVLAQRLLAEWLFASTPVARVEASTDVTNIPEQRALERAGFTREGVLRSAQERADGRHDLYSYSLLRTDLELVEAGDTSQR